MSDVDKLIKLIKEYTGPFAEHVVRHQMKVLSFNEDNHSSKDLQVLAKAVIENAIFDPSLRDEAKKRVRKELIL